MIKYNSNIYYCATEELARQFLEECDEAGIKWKSGMKAIEQFTWCKNWIYEVCCDYLTWDIISNVDDKHIIEYKGKEQKQC